MWSSTVKTIPFGNTPKAAIYNITILFVAVMQITPILSLLRTITCYIGPFWPDIWESRVKGLNPEEAAPDMECHRFEEYSLTTESSHSLGDGLSTGACICSSEEIHKGLHRLHLFGWPFL